MFAPWAAGLIHLAQHRRSDPQSKHLAVNTAMFLLRFFYGKKGEDEGAKIFRLTRQKTAGLK